MSETPAKNLQDYLMEHGILKNADAEKMAREITEIFESKITEKFARYEAACAEKDEALTKAKEAIIKLNNGCYPLEYCSNETLYKFVTCKKIEHALSIDCGKGVLDKIERLRDEITRLKSVVGEVDIELIDQALEETK